MCTSVRAGDPRAEDLARHAAEPRAAECGETEMRFGYRPLDLAVFETTSGNRRHRGLDRIIRDTACCLHALGR
ncbi:hypothetical protein ACWEQP_35390 [Streptomyces sp. NPDC004044]